MIRSKLNFKKSSFLLTFIFILLLFYFGYTLVYLNKTPPNTYFANESFSFATQNQLVEKVSQKIDSFENSRITFEVNDQKIEADPKTLGINFDKAKTVDNIWLQTKSANFKDDQLRKIKALFIKAYISPAYQVDFSKLSSSLDSLLGKFETKAKDATINFKLGKVEVNDESVGKVVNKGDLYLTLKDRLDNLSSQPINVSQIDDLPKIRASGTKQAQDKVETLNNQRIVLTFDSDAWKLSGNSLLLILKFYPYGLEDGYFVKFKFGQNPLTITWIKLADSGEPKLNVSLDSDKLNDFIDEIASSVDQNTVNATLRFENGKVTEFTPARDGQKLDKAQAKKLIADKVSIDSVSGEKDINIALPVQLTKAKIANEEINNLGVKELLGRGISYFAGSIANRIYNISLGSQRINGTLVKPQETFSFNGTVGEVSSATGYRQAYVISSGRTVLDDGGGICQVSTTVFRAALNAGLPIIERTAHAYRVAYYEQRGFKPGLDATVWAPAVDLVFKNDTANHILVQAIFDAASSKLEVDIYGTSDARQVKLTDPIISNVKPPLPDKYQDDPTLPKGIVKQVDFAAWGATSVFTREVFKNDQLIIDDTFKSYFKPWQAVYLVGTGG